MKFFTTILQLLLRTTCFFLLGVGFTSAASTSQGLNTTDHGLNLLLLPSETLQYFKIASLVITGTIYGVSLNFTGPIEKALIQLDKDANSFNLTALNYKILSEIVVREEAYRTSTTCLPIEGMNWRKAKTIAIAAGINYLKQGYMVCSAPGRTCVRISCSNGSAIYLCNNNEYGISHPCSQFADMAQAIKDGCSPRGGQQGEKTFGGQAYDSGGWYILIIADTNHC